MADFAKLAFAIRRIKVNYWTIAWLPSLRRHLKEASFQSEKLHVLLVCWESWTGKLGKETHIFSSLEEWMSHHHVSSHGPWAHFNLLRPASWTASLLPWEASLRHKNNCKIIIVLSDTKLNRGDHLCQYSATFLNLRHTYKTCWIRGHTALDNVSDNAKNAKNNIDLRRKKKDLQPGNHQFLPL